MTTPRQNCEECTHNEKLPHECCKAWVLLECKVFPFLFGLTIGILLETLRYTL